MLLWFVLRRLAFDRGSIALILAACVLYFSYLYHSNWAYFANDSAMHTQYVTYIGTHHALPPLNLNAAARHPPSFYVMAAGFYDIGAWIGGQDPLAYVRYLPMLLYLAFIVTAALTLRLLFPTANPSYYIALAMLVFWPVGVTKVGVISCDTLLYPAEMGVIYFLLRWTRERHTNRLADAMLCAGIAMLAKNNALVPLLIGGGYLLHALWAYRAQLRAVLTPRLLGSVAFAVVASVWTLSRDHLENGAVMQANAVHDWSALVQMYLYFNPYEFLHDTIINPFSGEDIVHFWHYYLRSLLLGDYISWKALPIVFAFGIVWLTMILYILYGLARHLRFRAEKGGLLLLLQFAALLTGMLIYVFYRVPQPNQLADGRYVYPIICIIVAFYGKAMEWHRMAGRELTYRVGRGLGIGFVVLTLLLFLTQDYILTGVH